MADNEWADWIGRSERVADQADPKPGRALAATFDSPAGAQPGDLLPYLWHWIYFLPMAPMSQMGPDGHPRRGGFLPPLPLERRMWAGGRLVFHGELRVGDALEKRSEILKVSLKEGKNGKVAFVTVKHEVSPPRGLAVEEEQDIAYVEMPKEFVPPKPIPLPENLDWQEPCPIDPVKLFRFSAVTFNAHRIHYDFRYATQVEKYPGLVIHGPLQAMLLMRAANLRNPGRRVARFSFRAVRPVFDCDALFLSSRLKDGGGLDLYTSNGGGHICMQADLSWHS